jgi:hypothetical protein
MNRRILRGHIQTWTAICCDKSIDGAVSQTRDLVSLWPWAAPLQRGGRTQLAWPGLRCLTPVKGYVALSGGSLSSPCLSSIAYTLTDNRCTPHNRDDRRQTSAFALPVAALIRGLASLCHPCLSISRSVLCRELKERQLNCDNSPRATQGLTLLFRGQQKAKLSM